MERHEDGAEGDARQAGHDRPRQRQSETGADEAQCQRERLEVADEPERALMADLAVPLVVGDVVDGPGFDQRRGAGCGSGHDSSEGCHSSA
jgi:hypothetical protein